jgi:hypothetical protein
VLRGRKDRNARAWWRSLGISNLRETGSLHCHETTIADRRQISLRRDHWRSQTRAASPRPTVSYAGGFILRPHVRADFAAECHGSAYRRFQSRKVAQNPLRPPPNSLCLFLLKGQPSADCPFSLQEISATRPLGGLRTASRRGRSLFPGSGSFIFWPASALVR